MGGVEPPSELYEGSALPLSYTAIMFILPFYGIILCMDCVFCKIVKDEIPSYKVHENDKFYSFLSINPHHVGHTLVIPKTHVDDFFDMDENLLKEILIFSKPISDTLNKAFSPKTKRVGVVVAGLEISHAHLHLIPMDLVSDLYFSSAKQASPEELQQALDKIKAVLNS